MACFIRREGNEFTVPALRGTDASSSSIHCVAFGSNGIATHLRKIWTRQDALWGAQMRGLTLWHAF
jgi:hypothetical protein